MRRDILLTVGARVLIVTAGLLSSVITARVLGPKGRGEYFFLVTLSAAIVQFGALGLHASNTYLVAKDRARLPALTANSLLVALAVGGIGGTLVALLLPRLGFFPDTPDRFFWYAAALTPPTLFFLLGSNLLVGMGRIATFNFVDVASRAIVLLALVVAGVFALDVDGFAAASILAWTAAALMLGAMLRSGLGDLRFDRESFRSGFRFAAKTYAVAILGFAVLRGSVFLLQHYYGSVELGYYSIATQIADVLALFPTSVALVLFPALVRDRAGSWRTTRRSFVTVVATLIAAAAAAWVLAEPFIRVVYGAEFTPAAAVLRWQLPGVVAIGATAVVSQYLAAHGLPRTLIGAWVAGLVALVVLGFTLVPDHAGSGAAAALSASYVLVLCLVLLLAWRVRRGEGAQSEAGPSEPLAGRSESSTLL